MDQKSTGKTVSVAVVTYHPEKDKLFLTIESIIKQKYTQCQIVVSDDGSDQTYFDDLQDLFAKHGFENYHLIANTMNQGTVKNCLAAVNACTGDYVKTISPGDYFLSEQDLAVWTSFMEREDADWSFCEASYYKVDEYGKTEILKKMAHPQNIRPYLRYHSKRKEEHRKWNYVVLKDNCLGAATLCKREILKKYLEEIQGKVIYTEDIIYRLMMFDGKKVCYFPKKLIMYECGTGISTSGNSVWLQRISNDWNQSTKMLLNRCDDTKTGRKYYHAISIMDGEKSSINRIRKLMLPGFLENKMRILFFQRKTE